MLLLCYVNCKEFIELSVFLVTVVPIFGIQSLYISCSVSFWLALNFGAYGDNWILYASELLCLVFQIYVWRLFEALRSCSEGWLMQQV